jgi:xanthine permease XanP
LKKPADLIYAVDEWPPTLVALITAVQHVGTISVNFIYPLVLARQAGIPAEEVANILRMGMLGLAVAVLLQATPRGPIGCHFLAPAVFASPYLAPGFIALQAGGMPLFWGMTIVAGVTGVLLALVWSRMRKLIPPEAAGLVVVLVGATIGLAGLRLLNARGVAGAIETTDLSVTSATLAIMIVLNIYGTRMLRLFCILIGIVGGYLISAATGLLAVGELQAVLHQPPLAVPSMAGLAWAFDAALIVPFAVTALAVAMTTTALVTTYQKITDADWVRPEMSSIRGGLLADGFATIMAGLTGSFGIAVGPANAGLVAATGVASRPIAYFVAALLVIIALQPTLAGILTLMPAPVMAAGLLFAAAFIMINGLQIITSRILDARRTIVIGLGLMTFLMIAIYPASFAGAPDWVKSVTSSPLVLATLVALTLNLIFRLGIRRRLELTFDPSSTNAQEVTNFIERNAGIWGARRDVVNRVKFAVAQAVEAIQEFCDPKGPIRLQAGYDEFDIDVSLAYQGAAFTWPDRPPSPQEIIDEEGHRELAWFLVRHQADRAETMTDAGFAIIKLHFRH